ncbi:hypothetical protein CASFOL_014637 [Castilleja foliolosa]|uniref:Helicase C-terminal domain-containing protein n=1 Tax=Castilleja foliolosa TaxID=1961234 RepID=A0ABD3DEY9_9LAMI
MVPVLQDSEDFDCPICISPPMDIVLHPHVLHLENPSDQTQLPDVPPPSFQTSSRPFPSPLGAKNSSSSKSSKVDYLIKLLTSSRDAKPSSKSVIFSQFREMLLMLEEPLKELGFNVIQLMSQTRSANVIKEFNVPAPEGPTILLASLKALNVGINLTAASTVYLLEPWWNPVVEEHAIDCVHQIGQVENVSIVRLIVRSTIEERILQLQENKRVLANKAVGKNL